MNWYLKINEYIFYSFKSNVLKTLQLKSFDDHQTILQIKFLK